MGVGKSLVSPTRGAALVLAAFVLSACVTGGRYPMGGKYYASPEEAFAQQDLMVRTMVNTVGPGPVSYPGKFELFLPTPGRYKLLLPELATITDPELIEYRARVEDNFTEAMAKMIKARSIFTNYVITRDSGVGKPTLAQADYGIWLQYQPNGVADHYLVDKSGRQPRLVEMDRSLPPGIFRWNNWLHSLEELIRADLDGGPETATSGQAAAKNAPSRTIRSVD